MHRTILNLRFLARQTIRTARRLDVTKTFFSTFRKIPKNTVELAKTNNVASPLRTLLLFNSSLRSYSGSSGTEIETLDSVMGQVSESFNKKDHRAALANLKKLLKRSDLTALVRVPFVWEKTKLQLLLEDQAWEDDFLSDLKFFEPDSAETQELLDRLASRINFYLSTDEARQIFFDKVEKAFPNNYSMTVFRANLLLSQGKEVESEFYLQRAIQINSNKSRAWTLLWLAKQSEEYLNKAISCSDSEQNMVLWLKYGKLLMTEGKFDEGLDCFKKIVQTAPADMLLSLEEVINQLTVQGNTDPALKLVRMWLEAKPKTAVAWHCFGVIFETLGDSKKSEKCFRTALQLDPRRADTMSALAISLPPAEAIPILLEAEKINPNLMLTHFVLAWKYGDLDQNEKALEAVNKSIALQNNHVAQYLWKGKICAKLGLYKEEMSSFNTYFTLTNQIYYVLMFEERFEEALEEIQREISNDSTSKSFECALRFLESHCLLNMDRFDEAIVSVDKTIEISEEMGDREGVLAAIKMKARLLAMSGNLDGAKQLVDILVQQADPNIALTVAAIINRIEGKYDEALTQMNQACEITSRSTDFFRYEAFLDIAEILEAKGDLKAAEKQYELTLEINPNAKRAAERLKAIRAKK